MQKKTLLIIDNSQVLMDLTKRILERIDYSVRCAYGIAGAHELLMDYTPDGIMLEKDLPDGCGFEFCRELRKARDIPIMCFSGSKEDEAQAKSAGANDFLKKPFDFEIMKIRLNAMMDVRPASV